MKKEKRFEIIREESLGLAQGLAIYRDKQTGVQYLFVKHGYGAGLTALLDKEGKPVVSERK